MFTRALTVLTVVGVLFAVCGGAFASWRWIAYPHTTETKLAVGERVAMRSGVELTVPTASDRSFLIANKHWNAPWLHTDGSTWDETVSILPQVRPDVRMVILRSYQGTSAQALDDMRGTLWFADGLPSLRATSPDGNVALYWDEGANKALAVTSLPGKETGLIAIKSFASSPDHVATAADVNDAFAVLWQELSIQGAPAPTVPVVEAEPTDWHAPGFASAELLGSQAYRSLGIVVVEHLQRRLASRVPAVRRRSDDHFVMVILVIGTQVA